ncbi:Protein fem-1-like protein [Leptotrombidium deliense]|uniref:Protein fem-1-like protein n=1 Tax=Leptotrombidium deliense TaxID=299467 RepID=A0A443SGS9_9ACAR|nr:Protein fem-1-like protein [Leptotrombidium deliense]
MWITGKVDEESHKDLLFNELHTECRLSAPGARLSYSLRNKLERFNREERKEVVSRVKEGCSPLFVACKKGNVDIVEYLITECSADVEQKGVYEVPDDSSIHYVTPLWCAAVAGKLNVLKCLVKYGANVNSVSDTGSTPARSACFMTHLDIVSYLMENGANILKPNFNGGTCLINSVQSVPLCELLLKHGADVNAQDIQCKTALHYAIQEHRFETTKLLLEHGADPRIKSRYGDDALQTACLKVATQIFDYLITNFEYSDERVAEAYELMGSTFLDEHYDLQAAISYWRKAIEIRHKNDSEPILKRNKVVAKHAYLNHVEFETLQELESLALDYDAIRVQSLLICERILGPIHKDMIFRLMYRGASYADNLHYQRCIDLWLYALELRIMKDTLLHTEACFAAQALVRLYLDLYEKYSMGILREKLQFDDVIETIRLLKIHLQSSMNSLKIRPVYKKQQENFDKILKVITHLFYVSNVIPKTPKQVDSIKNLVVEIHKMNPRNSNGDTLLHLAVSKSNTMKSNTLMEDPYTAIFPDVGVAELLLDCGAFVDAINFNQSTPLHIASTRSNYSSDVVDLLLEYGAHIDRRNVTGNQPYKLLSSIAECSVNPLKFVSLKCLAARKIVEKRIPFSGQIPTDLEYFIRIH